MGSIKIVPLSAADSRQRESTNYLTAPEELRLVEVLNGLIEEAPQKYSEKDLRLIQQLIDCYQGLVHSKNHFQGLWCSEVLSEPLFFSLNFGMDRNLGYIKDEDEITPNVLLQIGFVPDETLGSKNIYKWMDHRLFHDGTQCLLLNDMTTEFTNFATLVEYFEKKYRIILPNWYRKWQFEQTKRKPQNSDDED